MGEEKKKRIFFFNLSVNNYLTNDSLILLLDISYSEKVKLIVLIIKIKKKKAKI